MHPTIDDRDRALIDDRTAAYNAHSGPRVGDFVDFACGTTRRISHLWIFEHDATMEDDFQSADGGSWYLGKGYVSFSGALYTSVPLASLTLTAETREGNAWVFHHDSWRADNAVYFSIPFRVYVSTQPAPKY